MLRPSLSSSKQHKVLVLGPKYSGKTSILHQAIYGSRQRHVQPKVIEDTIEDIYTALIDNERGTKEKINFFDFGGFSSPGVIVNCDIIKNHFIYADGVIIVYAINDKDSFLVARSIADQIKKSIEKLKEKKEIPIICLGNKLDKFRERQVEHEDSHLWAQKEKIKLFEVTTTERKTLIEAFVYLASKINPPQSKSTFPQLSRKGKPTGNITLEL